jgi:predicted S18 family serine protease
MSSWEKFGKIVFGTILLIAIFLLGYFGGPMMFKEEQNNFKKNSVEEGLIKNTLVAVDPQGRGVTALLTTRVRRGDGLVLVNINNVLADISMQESARTATKVGAKFANVNPSSIDVIFNIDAPAELVSGGSAGSTMAMAVISMLLNETPREDIMMTGEIKDDGSIGQVQSVTEKAKTAQLNNASMFLVPSGSSTEVVRFVRQKKCGEYNGYEFCEVNYFDDSGSLSDVIGIPVIEVEDIADAASYYFGYKL